ncbi:ABC transporter, permease protein [Roseibacterium elongatum DSM 19469]|uniref:ABC transporter, permease protein n=1 Tax=Roseicyclus elongatus DSM 19469 TaxID=1294273 RepID=W8RQM6_9RHOB|nr:ABC transporter permease [Roseibacterium elongatum]AHM03439.1 ABC transporter, permease protein [Roseibacterium elongatum DSM 19469]
MFQTAKPTSTRALVFNFLEVTYHASVRKVRQTHGNALLAIGLSLLQSLMFIAAFYFMFNLMGTRTAAIRGNFTLYLLTGIFLYLTHIQAVSQILKAEGPTSSMMQHAPMNTLVAILSAALSTLYVKMISLLVILFVIHVLMEPVEIHNWSGALMMYLLAWGSGCAVGLVFLALKPWAPDFVNIAQMVYIRANMIASGKMFVANMLPGFMINMFDWNPLFHIIDQARGYTFVNYFPHNTNWQYAFYVTIGLIFLGMLGDFYTRKHASASWDAKR